MQEISLYPYEIDTLVDALIEEQIRLEDEGIVDGRYGVLDDALEAMPTEARAKDAPFTVQIPDERPISDALMNEMYKETRRLVEDGPDAMGDLGELARLYRKVFGYGSEQSIRPRNERSWGYQ